MPHSEPRNPLYILLLLAGVVFCLTAVAYAVVPVLEQKAADAGSPPPPSAWRDALRAEGWRWLLYEVAVLFVVGIASMVVDRLRSLRESGNAAHNSGDNVPDDTQPGADARHLQEGADAPRSP
jgi:hypothetical protein